jgi:hypothetical protein
MKRQGAVFNRRELKRARNLVRWVANGCNWKNPVNATSIAAKSSLNNYAVCIEVLGFAKNLANQGNSLITQSIAGAAVDAVLRGDLGWADDLMDFWSERGLL